MQSNSKSDFTIKFSGTKLMKNIMVVTRQRVFMAIENTPVTKGLM